MAVVETDAQALADCQQGHWDAFEALYDRHAQPVLAYLLGMLGNRDLAEDELQEVFVSFAKRIPHLRTDSNVRAYLLTSARNRAANARRRAFRQANMTKGYEVLCKRRVPALPNGLTLAQLEEQRQALNAALGALPDEEREVVLLHTQSGFTFREVAEVVDRPQGTVATQYRTALGRLKDKLSHA